MTVDEAKAECAEFVNACEGKVIVGSWRPIPLGVPMTVHYLWDGWNCSFDVRETAIREASREEWLACAWPRRGPNGLIPRYFYQVVVD